MTLDDLAKLFEQTWSAEPQYQSLPRSILAPIQGVPQHRVFPLSQLSELIAELKILDDNTGDEDEEVFCIRYLVSTEKQILFAREGRPSRFVPQHKQIRRICLAAGNIYFSRDFEFITKINHCSGDFQPQSSSLLWPLSILAHLGAPLAEKLLVEECSVNCHDIFQVDTLHEITAADLKNLIPAELPPNMVDINKSLVIETGLVSSSTPSTSSTTTNTSSSGNSSSLVFSDSSDSSPPPTPPQRQKRSYPNRDCLPSIRSLNLFWLFSLSSGSPMRKFRTPADLETIVEKESLF